MAGNDVKAKKIKVKVLEVVEGYYDESYGQLYNPAEQSDWEELTAAELETLRRWAIHKNAGYPRTSQFIVITEAEIKIKQTVQSYLRRAEQELAQVEEKKRKQQDAETERKRKNLTKKEAKDRAKLSELLQQYPDVSQDAKVQRT